MNIEIGKKVEDEGVFETWAILELMGHRRLAGLLTEVEIAGAKFFRIDIYPPQKGTVAAATQFYSPSAVYAITPTTEETARRCSDTRQVGPVQLWELPAHNDDEY